MLPINALYIDISAFSYAIPIIAGIFIAVSSSIYLWWRKVKSKVSKKLGIDENAGKEVEEDLVINDAETTETVAPENSEENKEEKI